jgi:serine/threonine protein kinase
VFSCIDEDDNKMYALKAVKKKKLNKIMRMTRSKEYNFLESEMAILKKLEHPNCL